jgi:hypothetical protein
MIYKQTREFFREEWEYISSLSGDEETKFWDTVSQGIGFLDYSTKFVMSDREESSRR